jgi:hypothetical protein
MVGPGDNKTSPEANCPMINFRLIRHLWLFLAVAV